MADVIAYDDDDTESLKLALVLFVVIFLNTLLDFTQRQNAEKVKGKTLRVTVTVAGTVAKRMSGLTVVRLTLSWGKGGAVGGGGGNPPRAVRLAVDQLVVPMQAEAMNACAKASKVL